MKSCLGPANCQPEIGPKAALASSRVILREKKVEKIKNIFIQTLKNLDAGCIMFDDR